MNTFWKIGMVYKELVKYLTISPKFGTNNKGSMDYIHEWKPLKLTASNLFFPSENELCLRGKHAESKVGKLFMFAKFQMEINQLLSLRGDASSFENFLCKLKNVFSVFQVRRGLHRVLYNL